MLKRCWGIVHDRCTAIYAKYVPSFKAPTSVKHGRDTTLPFIAYQPYFWVDVGVNKVSIGS